MTSAKPITALRGVRSSWLILARNSLLAWLAASARSRSFSIAAFASSSSLQRSFSARSARHFAVRANTNCCSSIFWNGLLI